jgi:[amino group carrier protein]-lysine/ornithine hydrolase
MNQTESVDLLRAMLEIDSPSGGEERIAAFLAERMERAGFAAHVDEAGNAVGTVAGPGEPEFDVVLLGHMDTVPGRVPVRLDGDLLYGRGAVDAKGPLAAFVAAASDADLPRGVRVTVVGAVEEEAATSRGARHVAGRLRPHACVIGEPSGWDAVTLGYKGRLLVDYRAERAVSHSAGPEPTAAEEAVAWWNEVRAYADAFNDGRTEVFDQLLCGLRRINTRSDGLTQTAEASVGLRLPPGFDVAAFADFASGRAHDAAVRCHGAEVAFRSERTTPLAAPFLQAIRKSGGSPRFKVKTGTSDMNVVGPVWNCPILAYGPGDSRLDHTPNEHVSVAEFLRSVEILSSVIGQLPTRRPAAA